MDDDEAIPGAVERRAAELGCRVFSIGDDYGHPDGSPAQVRGSYVLRTAADGSWYDIWSTSLPLAGIVDALDRLEREHAGDPGAWSDFGAAWSNADEPGRAAFVLRRMSAWANGESERGLYSR